MLTPWPAIVPDSPDARGWRTLRRAAGEEHRVRTDLGGTPPTPALRALLAFVQVSDLHVTDAQSPARAEFLDRLGDDDSPVRAMLGPIGTYRTQESLTAQVVEAMARSLRRVDRGPVTGAEIAFAVSTGDAADNAQGNEVEASLRLLGGGAQVVPDSGDRTRWEGVGSADGYDARYWHPDGTPPGEVIDRPRQRYGFPLVPGLLDAARAPFAATGVAFPWYPVHGNHDRLLCGTVAANRFYARLARGGRKPVGWPARLGNEALVDLLSASGERDVAVWPGLAGAPTRSVAPDPERRLLDVPAWLAAHSGRSAVPAGAGTWYGFDAGPVRALVLDTVDHEGGWQGSLGADQLAWLEGELEAASDRFVDGDGRLRAGPGTGRPVVLFSHHPLRCMTNEWSPSGAHRVLAAELAGVLARFPALVAWVNGHTHVHNVVPHRRHPSLGGGWWEVTTASHVDWPQQARVIELAVDGGGQLVLAGTVVDHAGAVHPDPGDLGEIEALAGWSRLLAANDWQRVDEDGTVLGAGRPHDRNVLLVCPAPGSPREWSGGGGPAGGRRGAGGAAPGSGGKS
ncbi:MAG: TIGR03767 family metallophosphoesterase [Acidimicrobiales bacterium]